MSRSETSETRPGSRRAGLALLWAVVICLLYGKMLVETRAPRWACWRGAPVAATHAN